MTDIAARITARAALCAAPSTPCSADEVAYALGRRESAVREAMPEVAYTPAGGRTMVAPWSAWLRALGYRGDDGEATGAGGGGARAGVHDAAGAAGRRAVVLAR